MSGSVEPTADRRHPTLDMTRVGRRIRSLHDQVCGHRKRVEITRDGCDDVCVMISKCELEALEHALAVHASTPGHADLCRSLAQLLADAAVVYRPQAHGEHDVVQTFADDVLAGA